jgi:hypothetical protein
MLYELQRDDRIVYCNSREIVSALLEAGWTQRDSPYRSPGIHSWPSSPPPGAVSIMRRSPPT